MEIEPGAFVKAISNFDSDVSGDLNLVDGDIIKVTSVVNDDWLEGLFGDESGIFPKSHCIALKFIPSSDPYGVALYHHEAHLHDELSFKAGDQVFFSSRVNPEWYNGTCNGQTGMFPISYVSIVFDLPVAPGRPAKAPDVTAPERPKSLDSSTVAALRTKSLSKRNSVHPSEAPDNQNESSKRAPPNFPPPPPPTQISSPMSEVHPNLSKSSPQRPPSIVRPDPPSRHPLCNTDSESVPNNTPEATSQPGENYEVILPSRPPPLDTESVVVLRERSRSQGKRSKGKSPSRPPSTYMETPSTEKSPSRPPSTYMETTLTENSAFLAQPDLNDDPAQEAGGNLSPGFTPLSHPGFIDWNAENVAERPLYVEDTNLEEEKEEDDEEAVYANAADIQAVEEEYKTTAAEDAALRKLHKSIAEKEKMLAAEQESKTQTEDLLAQQFSGKKIDKENVELLRSLLNAHNEKITDLCNRIDSMKAKARTLKSPTGKPDKLDGIEKRDKVVIELIETEESNLKELKLCITGFLHTLRCDDTHTMDIDMMFLNIENIAGVAEKLLMMLKGQQTLMSHEQMIGRCFTHLEEDLHREYTFYLENQASVMDLIAQYQKDKANKELLDNCLKNIRGNTTCWDLSSFLIRPVQRIMKYPLFLRDIIVNTPAHWVDRPYLVTASEIVDNIVVYANENKRKDELIKRYNEEVTDSSLLPKLTLHSLKKKSKRLTTTLTHSLNITSSVVEDSTFGDLSEKFASLVLIIKTLIREASNFTDLLKKVQVEMDDLCTNIHDFYDNLITQKNVFLYHGAALKIAQNYTPRFIKDLEEGPLGTLSDLLAVFNAPQYFIEKRNSKILDYDNLAAQTAEGSLASENLRIARGEFEALNKQLLDDLPILIHEGAEVVKKSSYSVLALFCQYSHACHDEFRRALDKMSLELDEPPDSIYLYHLSRMKTCCATLLTISSFDKEVTQAIVLGSSIKPTVSKFYESETCEEDQPATCSSYDVNKWLANQPDVLTALSSDENEEETEQLEDIFEKPGIIEDVKAGTVCRVLYDFTATSDTMLDVNSGDTAIMLSDCLISDTWAYVQCGGVKGYIPKSYLTLSGTLKNKPAPLPPSATQDKVKSIKRRAPPPPKRTVSEVSLPSDREPENTKDPDPVSQPPIKQTDQVPQPDPKQPDPVSQPSHKQATYTTVDKTTRLHPKRSAPPPPMSRRSTAPQLRSKARTFETLPILEDTSDSSGGGILSGKNSVVIEETPKSTAERDIMDLSSNLDDIDLLGGSGPASTQEQHSYYHDSGIEQNITKVSDTTNNPDPPIPISERSLPCPPNLVPVPIPLKSNVLPEPQEPYYEVIDSETSSEYNSLPPPPDEVLATEEFGTHPPEVFSSPFEIFPDLPEPNPNNGSAASPDGAHYENLAENSIKINPAELTAASYPERTNQDIPTPELQTLSSPPVTNPRSTSVSVTSHPRDTSHVPPPNPRSASVSVPLSTASTRQPDSTTITVKTNSETATHKNSGPSVPSSPVPKLPTKAKEKKPSPMFDECPMEMSMIKKQESSTNYEAQYNYRARSPAELSLSVRQVVSVVDSSHSDWWFVKAGRRQGFVPASFLKTKS